MSRADKKKGLILYPEANSLIEAVTKDTEILANVDWSLITSGPTEPKALQQLLQQYDVGLIGGQWTLHAYRCVQRRSVGSHFLNYMDWVYQRSGQLWGLSVFSEVFRQFVLQSMQKQDYKGSVIFLGESPLVFPMIDVLATFGFEDFVLLKLPLESMGSSLRDLAKVGLLGVQISAVDSSAFIQSQKEYSFCFVMEGRYPKQTLDDMSYFHFLSSNSMVFELVESSNFLFAEVEALGVELKRFAAIQEIWLHSTRETLLNMPEKQAKRRP